MSLTTCRHCSAQVAASAKECLKCGGESPGSRAWATLLFYLTCAAIIIVMVLLSPPMR